MSFVKIGYYKSWDLGSLPPENIDVNVYTHICYAFCDFDNNGNLCITEGDTNALKRLATLKRKSNVKLLISIGGWNAGSANFSSIASDKSKIENLAASAVSALRTYNFDGLDIDWEYPGQREGSSPRDKDNFINMLRLIGNKFSSSYLLTTAVSALADPSSYDIKGINNCVDFIHVMTYDFHHAADKRTGHNAPLYRGPRDNDWEKENSNCDVSINKWLNGGASSKKLVLGLAFYGQLYNLKCSSDCEVGAPTLPTGGVKTYKEISGLRWSEKWDDHQKVPYKYSGKEWIGYDNARSINLKVKYAKNKNLGGVLVWTINDDNGSFDLTGAIKEAA